MKRPFFKNASGFTLVELLVAVSILVVLTVISLTTFSSVQKNGRDSKRKADLATIQGALEQYHADIGFYPLSPLGTQLNSPKKYLDSLPSDPKEGVYCYETPSCASNCTKYNLYAFLENTPPGSNSACSRTDYNYKVNQP